MTNPVKSFSIEELQQHIADAGLPSFRSMQVLEWLYKKGASSYEEMSNLPKSFREQFAQVYPLHAPLVAQRQVSVDGSRKYLLQFGDGAFAETVGLPSSDGRLTVCVSSQAGCAMQCLFCATGQMGLNRSLQPGELVDQVLVVQNDFGMRVTNVVVMGQGEPFANYDAVIAALRILNHPKLLAIGARHITVSTCGVLPGIRRFADEPEQFTLAVSLHSAIQKTRNALMPAMANQDLERLRNALEQYSNKTGRRFSFEYALMKGMNDGQKDLQALIDYCKGLMCHINLIPLNAVEDSPVKPVSDQVLQRWQQELEHAGIAASIRNSRGGDIAAACGQLAYKNREA